MANKKFLGSFSLNSDQGRLKKTLIEILKVGIGLWLLLSALSTTNWVGFRQSFIIINSEWVIIAVITVLVSSFVKILRFFYLLRNYQVNCSFWSVVQSFFIGQAANIILPFRGGEIVRFGVLIPGRRSSATEIAATIAFEKYLDLLAITLFSLPVLFFLPVINISWVREVLVPISIVGSLALLGFVFWGPWAWKRMKERFDLSQVNWLSKTGSRIDKFVKLSLWMRQPRKLVLAICFTAGIWVTMVSTNLFLFRAFGLDLGTEAGVLVLVLIYIGLLPALMPGNMGPFYFFAQLALTPFHVESNLALSYSVILHLIVTVPPLLLGGLTILAQNQVLQTRMKSFLTFIGSHK